MVLVLDDNDVMASLDADRAIGWMREALLAAHSGRLTSPPRVGTDLGAGRLVFTTGALAHAWFGYRSYDTFDVAPGEQVVVVHDAEHGRVRGIAVGNELGLRRVGAIGGVAGAAGRRGLPAFLHDDGKVVVVNARIPQFGHGAFGFRPDRRIHRGRIRPRFGLRGRALPCFT